MHFLYIINKNKKLFFNPIKSLLYTTNRNKDLGEILHPWRLDEVLGPGEILAVQEACEDVMQFFGYNLVSGPEEILDLDNFQTVRFDTQFTL